MNPHTNIFAFGQTFCDSHTHLHLFKLISSIIMPARCNFLLLYHVIYAYFEVYSFLNTPVRLRSSDMHYFSLSDLHTLGKIYVTLLNPKGF